MAAVHPGRRLAVAELFDVPRRFREGDTMELFDGELPKGDPRRVNRKMLRDGELPTLASLEPKLREEFERILIGLSAETRTSITPSDVSFLLIERVRRELVRLLEGKGATLSGRQRPKIGDIQDPLLLSSYTKFDTETEADMSGSGGSNYGVTCLAALTATFWLMHDLGKLRQQQLRISKDRRVLVRGFWKPDGCRLREQDIRGASELAVKYLGVDAVENHFFSSTRSTFDAGAVRTSA